MLQNFKLQYTNNTHNNFLNAGIWLVENLDGALLGYLHDALFKLLALHGVNTLNSGKMFGCEGGNALKAEVLALFTYSVADGEDARVKNTDNVTGKGLVDYGALLCHKLLGLGKAQALATLHMEILLIPFKAAGADAHEGDTVTVGLVHVGLNFEYECGKMFVKRIDDIVVGYSGQGRHGHFKEAFKERLNTEVVESRAEEHGAEAATADFLNIKVVACTVQKLYIIGKRLSEPVADKLVQLFGLIQLALDSLNPALATVELIEGQNMPFLPVENALELTAAADGPVHGIGADAKFVFQLLHKLVGASGLTVQLVDEGEDGNMAHGAYLEKLSGLGLNALCSINYHNGGVRRHEGAVGVLREVLMARSVQNIDAVAVILKLHDR